MNDRPSLAVALWYLVVAGLGWWGWAISLVNFPDDMVFFSNIMMLCVAVVYSALVIAEFRGGAGRAGVVARGACAMYGVVVAIIFNTLLDADLSYLSSFLEHALVPGLVLIDWLAVRRGGGHLGPGVVVTWMVVPLLYIPVYTLNDRPRTDGLPIYAFLDPDADDYWPMVCAFAGFFVIVGLVVWSLRRGNRARPASDVSAQASDPRTDS